MNFSWQLFFNNFINGYRGAILKENYLWLLLFYMTVAAYCYYEKVCRTMHTTIVLNLLKEVSSVFIMDNIYMTTCYI